MAIAADADGIAQRIIRKSGRGKDRIARGDQRKHCRSKSVRSVYKAGADQRGFGVKDLCVDLIQCFSSEIVIAVPCRSGEAGVRYPIVLECSHDFAGILLGDLVNAVELRTDASFSLFCKSVNLIRDFRYLHLSAP